MPIDFKQIQEKWIKRWDKDRVFEANPNSKDKFFVTFPYPYMNSLLHIGHFYTMMRVDAFARFKRMVGFNVLFPQGWHCTGSPIESAAKRIAEKEPKQIELMKKLGIPDDEIDEFSDPKKWTEFFPKEAEKDMRALGMSVDWRRSFITTSLNPYYDAFIKWQFIKLKEKGLVVKGKHPVVWDPKENCPLPDHGRVEGEGETPQEFTLLKFRFGSEFITAATLRPETVYGQTNLWINPEVKYRKALVDGEVWIGSDVFFEKLKNQDHEVELKGIISGFELIGKKAIAPMIEREIIILPASFCDPSKGTGIVTSVPSDAPDDYIGLRDLQQSKEECEKYGLDFEEIQKIAPIPIIDSSDLGDLAAVKVVTDMKIQNQYERKKLEDAKKLVYKKGFYEGKMGKLSGEFAGKPVIEVKDEMKDKLIRRGEAVLFYELTGKVVSRSLAEGIVKIVSDQWFLNYKNIEWKKKTHEALDSLHLYPELARAQFNYVIDWLNDWPCTREFGLGTSLPWDKDWVIESLSDSTIYMAFYTIAHRLKDISVEALDEDFFDYVFLGKDKELKVEKGLADSLRKEFSYWYPVDFRNSGKDLIQNHLTFFLFNHVAIWESKDFLPKGIGVNGWITVNGEKMSKSRGNFILLRELPEKFGCDSSRFTVLSSGEGLDDANFEIQMAGSMKSKISEWLDFSERLYNSKDFFVGENRVIDKWFESELNRIIKETTESMDIANFKSALKVCYYEFYKVIKWYLYRSENKPKEHLIKVAVLAQMKMLSPVMPFISEELNERLGFSELVCVSEWPVFDFSKIDGKYSMAEKLLQQTIGDVRQIMALAKISKPSKVVVFVSPDWKWDVFDAVMSEMVNVQKPDFGFAMKIASKVNSASAHKKEVPGFVKVIISKFHDLKSLKRIDEYFLLLESVKTMEKELNCEVEIVKVDSSQNNPKAQKAFPMKPAILVE